MDGDGAGDNDDDDDDDGDQEDGHRHDWSKDVAEEKGWEGRMSFFSRHTRTYPHVPAGFRAQRDGR